MKTSPRRSRRRRSVPSAWAGVGQRMPRIVLGLAGADGRCRTWRPLVRPVGWQSRFGAGDAAAAGGWVASRGAAWRRRPRTHPGSFHRPRSTGIASQPWRRTPGGLAAALAGRAERSKWSTARGRPHELTRIFAYPFRYSRLRSARAERIGRRQPYVARCELHGGHIVKP
jgi:hypothetical protein